MHEEHKSDSDSRDNVDHTSDGRVLDVAMRILTPLAQLSVASGVRLAQLEEVLKRALIEAGRTELQRADIRINMSRLSVSTGVHRKDVKRLTEEKKKPQKNTIGSRSAASALYTYWSSSPLYKEDGAPMRLPYRAPGKALCFESLARQFTTDAHPRTLLEEMQRLGLLSVNEQTEVVTLIERGFVPDKNGDELFELLAANVGDHFGTAVSNVLGIGSPRLEQSVFDEGLSEHAATVLDQRCRQLWHDLMRDLVPLMEELAEQDRQLGRLANQRVRVGMYAHRETVAESINQSTATDKERGQPWPVRGRGEEK